MTPFFQKKQLTRLMLFAAVCVSLFGLFLYFKSAKLKKQGDDFLRYGNPEEAIRLYEEAKKTFPLRIDIANDIEGAKLIKESKKDYEQIDQVFAELQEVPPIANLPSVRLNPNELYVPILMYHHIRTNPRPNDPVWAALNIGSDQLDQQLAYLSTHNYQAITLDDLTDALDGKRALPVNPIVLTFDDGYRNFYENAYPLLKKYHMKAIEFVITQVVGIPAYLTWDQIQEMDRSGLVEFGAHTRHHPNLTELSRRDIVNEVTGSKKDLEDHLKRPIRWFAYPYGSYNSFIIQTVQKAGFTGAVSTIYGTNQSKEALYLAPRIMVDGRFSLDNIARRIQK